MICLKLSSLLSGLSYTSDHSADGVEVTGVSDHTAAIMPGHLFLCVRGKHFDPIPLLPMILRAGVSAILAPRELSLGELSVPVFYVEDIRAAAATVWNNYYGRPSSKMKLVAVTGTNGKTTTARILCHLLEVGGIHSGYIGTLGVYDRECPEVSAASNTMTTPDPAVLYGSLARLAERGVQVAVMEVSSHAIAMQRVSPLSFEIGIFTNLSAEHLDFHPSMEDYYATKRALFRQCAVGIFNIDDAYGERMSKEAETSALACGIVQAAPYAVLEPNENGKMGTNYIYQTPYTAFPISCPLIGAFNYYNSMLAVTAALQLGLCPDEIGRGMASLPVIPGRMERLALDEFQTGEVIIDYAHTPYAMEAALKAARRQTVGRLIALFGAGGERDASKRGKMGALAVSLADFVYITSDNTRGEPLSRIIKDILVGVAGQKNYRVVTDRRRAICEALDELRPGDTLLLLGKGHETYDWGANGLSPFSEREIVLNHLKEQRQ